MRATRNRTLNRIGENHAISCRNPCDYRRSFVLGGPDHSFRAGFYGHRMPGLCRDSLSDTWTCLLRVRCLGLVEAPALMRTIKQGESNEQA